MKTYNSLRFYFPTEWVKTAISQNQVVGVPMPVTGLSVINAIPVEREMSIISAGIVLSQAVSTNFIEFRITIEGVEQIPGKQMGPSDSTKYLIEIPPGKIVVQKGELLGVNWGSHPSMTPTGVIEALVILKVQPV